MSLLVYTNRNSIRLFYIKGDEPIDHILYANNLIWQYLISGTSKHADACRWQKHSATRLVKTVRSNTLLSKQTLTNVYLLTWKSWSFLVYFQHYNLNYKVLKHVHVPNMHCSRTWTWRGRGSMGSKLNGRLWGEGRLIGVVQIIFHQTWWSVQMIWWRKELPYSGKILPLFMSKYNEKPDLRDAWRDKVMQ